MYLLISNIAQVILLLIALAFKDDDNHSVFPLYSPSQPDNLIISSARPQTRRTPGGHHVPPTARPLRWCVYPRTHHRQIHLWILHGFSMSRRIRLHRIRLGQRRSWIQLQRGLECKLRHSFPSPVDHVFNPVLPSPRDSLGSEAFLSAALQSRPYIKAFRTFLNLPHRVAQSLPILDGSDWLYYHVSYRLYSSGEPTGLQTLEHYIGMGHRC